jgi:predicted Zn-dependent protease
MSRYLLLCLALAAGSSLGAPGEPYLPAGDEVVLQTVPTKVDPRVRQFEVLRAAWQSHPGDIGRAVALSTAYLDYARGTGDARYLGRAEAVIEPWLKAAPAPLPAMLLDATILQSRHLFDESKAELLEILARDRDNAQAWLTLATVAQVQGDVDTSRYACAHLIGGADALVAGACLAALNAVTGHPREGYRTIATLLAAEPGEAPALQAWAEGLLADAALYSGDDAPAEAHYKAALQLSPGDNFLLADYADFLLDHQRPQEAAALLQDFVQSDTSFLRLCIAEDRLHAPQAADDAAQMAARFAATDQRGSYLYRREEALFALSVQRDAPSALGLARQNWTVQRAPQDARILLQAARFAGQPEAARPVLEFIDKTGLREPHVDQLAAEARKALQAAVATPAGAARS